MSIDNDVGEIKQIVELLRHPPFNRNESLVQFSNKRPSELLQLVNDVFTELDSFHKKDITEENPELMTARMLEFITALKYPIPDKDLSNFGEQFIKGNPSIIYPLLYYLLSDFDKLKKRAYVSRYLKPFEIPEEYYADMNVLGMYQQYKIKQSEFKEIHKNYEGVKKNSLNPIELEAELQQLSLEREQLLDKLSKLKEKNNNDPSMKNVNFQEMLSVTNLLRQEQEEENKIIGQIMEQKIKLQRMENIKNTTNKKLSDLLNSDLSKIDPTKLLNRLRNEVSEKKLLVDDKLENAIREREKQLKQLEKILSGVDQIGEEQIIELEQGVSELHASVKELERKREDIERGNDGKIAFYRERATAIEKKKEKILEQVKELEDEKKEADDELKKLNHELKLMSKDGKKPMTDKEMKQYMTELTKKTEDYKKKKADIEADKSEISILQRTEEILRSRDQNIIEFNQELEKQRGISGFSSLSETLETVAVQNAEINATKGEKLDEISALVEQISTTLKDKKNKLAPQIKELRSVRSKYEEIESIYLTKKKQYDNISLGYESERIKLEQDVNTNIAGIQEEESSYHFLNCLNSIARVKMEQITKESKYLSGEEKMSGPGGEYKSYKDCYEKSIAEQELLTKSLRNEKKTVTESHDTHVAQRSMFYHLKQIVGKKLFVAKMDKENKQKELMGGAEGISFGDDRQQ